jgi:hypothetical protein
MATVIYRNGNRAAARIKDRLREAKDPGYSTEVTTPHQTTTCIYDSGSQHDGMAKTEYDHE